MADYYGAPESGDNKVLTERLRDYYADTDFVKVQNIDTEPLKYQFMDPKNEQFVQTAPYNGETYQLNPPTVHVLQPGESKLCNAAEADAMIVTLVKKITTKEAHHKIAGGGVVRDYIANWNDPQTQITLLKDIIIGKEDLINKYNEALNAPTVEQDLEETDESPRPRRGRPATAQ